MFETKYYKDFRHNYLILKEMDAVANSYQCRMITENKINGLLDCQERHINGEMLLYYNITSRQSLASIYESDYVTVNFIRKLMQQLQIAREGMMGYLLTERCLLLRPEYVYADVESGELSFLYFPYEPEENYMQSLMEFLTDRVDAEDKEAVEICYKILQLLGNEQFVLDEVLEWFEEDYGMPVREDWETETEEIHQGKLSEEEDYLYQPERTEGLIGKKTVSSGEKLAVGTMFAMFLGGAFLCYIFWTYEMTEREWIYFYGAVTGVITLFLLSGLYLIGRRLLFGKNSLLAHVGGSSFNQNVEEGEKRYQIATDYDEMQREEAVDYGNTVFIPLIEKCENKLYGVGKNNKNHIDLGRLPLTIGKLAGSVDMVITDQSLSRRHVKFSREGNKICMTDLNSTNGTYRNGLRMEPNASEIIEPGDEIRLGKLKFIYR